jgi:hypothetical protein
MVFSIARLYLARQTIAIPVVEGQEQEAPSDL